MCKNHFLQRYMPTALTHNIFIFFFFSTFKPKYYQKYSVTNFLYSSPLSHNPHIKNHIVPTAHYIPLLGDFRKVGRSIKNLWQCIAEKVSYITHAKFDKDPSSINPCTHVPIDPKTSNSLVEKSIENRVMQNTYQNGPWVMILNYL
jgi:hypothetical protein